MGWQYTKRTDGKIAVTLDNNAWDWLFNGKVALAQELPLDEFAILITREVEIETLPLLQKANKEELVAYISKTRDECDIKTTSVFGFFAPNLTHHRVGGFDQGTWQSNTEREYYDEIRERFLTERKEKGSGLNGNEGDAAVGAQSFFSIVLTCENSTKVGPLRFAAESGGRVLFLGDYDFSKGTLRDFVTALHLRE